MKIRADVAELLRAGLSDRAIATELGVDAKKTVRPARLALRLPPARPGRRRAASVDDLFWHRTQPTDGGHLLWTGCRTNGYPTVRHAGVLHMAVRVAFRIKYGRDPEGHVTLTCDREGCVAPAHTEDRRIRERTNTTFTAIFGEVIS